jgi:hypothetical protein
MAKREVIVELRLEDQNAVQRLGKLELETKKYREDLRSLNAEIKQNGVATRDQQIRYGELTAKIRSNQTVIRELKNDLSGATDAGLRFRDKMADAAKAGLGAFGLNLFGAAAAVTAFVGVLRNAGQTIAGFEQANANLASILGVSKDQISVLTDSAIALGPALGRLPREVTDLQTELAKLGFTTPQILEAQEAVILLANATGESLGKSAEVAAATIKGFGLDADQTQRVVDVMAQSFNATSLDLEKFSTAMATLAPAAKAAGFSFEETTALVGVLADRGLDASVVGTSLRSIFQDLAKTGMSLDDALAQINGSTNKNATAFELFGERAASAGIILAEAREETDRVTTSLQAAGGAAAAMGETQLDTLTGSINKLSASWSAFVLSLEKGDGVLGKLVRGTLDTFADILGGLAGACDDLDKRVEGFVDSVNSRLAQLGQLQTGESESLRTWVDQQTTLIRTVVKNNIADAERLAQARLKIQQEVEAAVAAGYQRVAAFALTKLEFFDAEVEARRKVLEATVQQGEASGTLVGTQQQEVRTLATLRTELKTLKEGLEVVDVTDQKAIATTKAKIAALEAEIKAIEKLGTARARSAAVTVDPITGIDVTQRASEVNPLPVPTPEQRTEAEDALIAYNLFAEEIRLDNIRGVEDYQTQLAALDAQHKAGLLASDQEYYALRDALMQQSAQREIALQMQKAEALSNLAGALAANMEEGSNIQKAFAVAQATINAYMAASQALAEQGVPYWVKVANAAAAVFQGLAYVNKILSTNPKGFAEGGYTAPGTKYKPVGTVHAGEWVAPAWQVNSPTFGPLIEWLEQQRARRTSGPQIPYVTGGTVTRGVAMVNAAGPGITATDMAQIESAVLSRMAIDRPMQVDVVEINKAQGRVRVADTLATA